MLCTLKMQKLLGKRHTLRSPMPNQQSDLPRRQQLMNHSDGNRAVSFFLFFFPPLNQGEAVYCVE